MGDQSLENGGVDPPARKIEQGQRFGGGGAKKMFLLEFFARR